MESVYLKQDMEKLEKVQRRATKWSMATRIWFTRKAWKDVD